MCLSALFLVGFRRKEDLGNLISHGCSPTRVIGFEQADGPVELALFERLFLKNIRIHTAGFVEYFREFPEIGKTRWLGNAGTTEEYDLSVFVHL